VVPFIIELFARNAVAVSIETARVSAIANAQRRGASGAGSGAIGIAGVLVAPATGIGTAPNTP